MMCFYWGRERELGERRKREKREKRGRETVTGETRLRGKKRKLLGKRCKRKKHPERKGGIND